MSEEKQVPRLDREDLVALLGVALFLFGVGCFSKPMAVIALGLILFIWAWVTSAAKKGETKGE
jgi:hypothetical protein